MKHEMIYEKFREIFPKAEIKTWVVNGPNGIQVDLLDGSILIFTYVSDEEWGLETIKLYVKNMKRDFEYKQLKRAREKIDALDDAWDRLVSTNNKILEDRHQTLDKAFERSVFVNER